MGTGSLTWVLAYKRWCLTLNVPITTKVVCFSLLLKCLRSLYGKQCGPRWDCSYRSSLFWVHTGCFYTQFVSNVRQLFSSDDFSRRHFQMHFFLGALRVKNQRTSDSLNEGLPIEMTREKFQRKRYFFYEKDSRFNPQLIHKSSFLIGQVPTEKYGLKTLFLLFNI